MMRRTVAVWANFAAVFMPALSPSMESGVVVEWKKKVGDYVKEGDVFCTVQTDKAVVDYTNSFEPGYLAKIFAPNGSEVTVAKTIAVMVDDEADLGSVDEFELPEGEESPAAPAPAAAAAEPAAAAPAAAAPSSSSSATSGAPAGTTSEPPDGVDVAAVFMPALSPSMESGVVVEWKKKVGDYVKEGDVFCTVQTDKAVVDYTNSFEPGYLAKIFAPNGSEVVVSKTIGVMVADEADVGKLANYYPEDAFGAGEAAAAAAPAAAAAAAAAAPAPTAAAPAAPKTPAGSAALYGGSVAAAVAASGPSVIRIAAGLTEAELAAVAPTGKGGRFLKSDFAGLKGFDYSDAVQPLVKETASLAAAGAKAAATPGTPATAAAAQSGVFDVVLTAGPVVKRVDDTALLRRLIATAPKPKARKAKPQQKEAAAAAN